MTTIKSVFEYSPQTLLVETRKHEGETYLRINNGKSPMGDVMVATADILAALDAVPRERMEEPCEGATKWAARADKAEAEAARFKDAFDDRVKSLQAAWDELGDLRAERDALAATVGRVRAWAEDYFWDVANEGLLAVLKVPEPPKPFVLPTEAGVRFYGDHNGYQTEFTTYSNGSDALYVSDDGDIWTPLQMDKVTDLRGAE